MTLTIRQLDLGDAKVDSSFPVWGMTPGTPIVLPIFAYLILGADHGPILVDAGFRDADALTAATGIGFSQSEDQRLANQLAAHHLTAAEIATVVLTHLHADHTGLLDQLPAAQIIVQRKELQYAAAPYFPVPFFDRNDIAKLVDPLFSRLQLVEGDTAVTPGVRTVLTGGHSPGHQMLEIDLASGMAIITGDLAYLVDPGVASQVPPGYVTSIEETMRGLSRIKRDATHVLTMHDPNLRGRYPDGLS